MVCTNQMCQNGTIDWFLLTFTEPSWYMLSHTLIELLSRATDITRSGEAVKCIYALIGLGNCSFTFGFRAGRVWKVIKDFRLNWRGKYNLVDLFLLMKISLLVERVYYYKKTVRMRWLYILGVPFSVLPDHCHSFSKQVVIVYLIHTPRCIVGLMYCCCLSKHEEVFNPKLTITMDI